ncbi:pilus assembly protein [Modestobacter sp. VKM Ac-2676]|nr:pilus assembly protein [Modestobacter sp. VKM Ac-2676]
MTQLYSTLFALAVTASDRLKKEERGATAVEYGLMVGLIAVVIIVAVTTLGTQLNGLFESVSDKLGGTATPAAGG